MVDTGKIISENDRRKEVINKPYNPVTEEGCYGERLACIEKMRTDNVPIRVILLKARQWGGSTLIQLYMYWIQNIHRKNWNSVICAHEIPASVTIRNYRGTQNIKEIPERGCTITVGTAIEPDSVRSQDAKMAHFSETAFFPNTKDNKTENLITSIVGSIPAEPLTLIAQESTANGVGDYFYEEWEKAKKGETAFEPVFAEWFLIDIYSRDFDGHYYMNNGKRKEGTIDDFIRTMDEYEINLFNNHGKCTLENINRRRLKRGEMPSEAKMKQEYPSEDIEAFQDSGLPAFRSEDVERLRKDCRKPAAIGVLSSDSPPSSAKMETKRRKEILSGIKFADDKEALEHYGSSDPKMKARAERDKLKIWEFPDTKMKISNRYVAVFDPQKGISESADCGVIAVFDRYWMMYGGVPEIIAL